MLSPSHHQCYKEFQQAIEQMLSDTTASDLDLAAMGVRLQEVKQVFQSQIVNLSPAEIAPAVASRWQSIQTEIYKQMRLLDTDMMMLQAARSPATLRNRVAGMSDRLNTLRQYCQVLLQDGV